MKAINNRRSIFVFVFTMLVALVACVIAVNMSALSKSAQAETYYFTDNNRFSKSGVVNMKTYAQATPDQELRDYTLEPNITIQKAADLYKILLPQNIDKDFFILNDIDLSADTTWHELVDDYEKGWMPIFAGDNTGTLYGNGHRIHNLKINRPNMDEVGLFATCSLDIVDLNVEAISANNEDAIIGGNVVGVISGRMIGNLTNVTAKGNIRSTDLAGGLVGKCSGKISMSNFEGNICAKRVGGLVGNSVSATITNAYAYANLIGKIVGGLIGIADYEQSSGGIRNGIAFGTVSNSGDSGLTRIGSFIGIRSDKVNVVNGYALNDYPSVAQGSDDGIKSLSKYAFVVESNFDFDFDKIWYMDDPALFPQIRHIVVTVNTNAKYISDRQVMNKSYYYKGEHVILNFSFDNVKLESLLIDGEESIERVTDNSIQIDAECNIKIQVRFSFLVELVTNVRGKGVILTDKKYFQSNDEIAVNVLADDGFEIVSLNARFNDKDVELVSLNDGTYSYKVGSEIAEGDQIIIAAKFEEIQKSFSWQILVIVLSIVVVLVVLGIITTMALKKKLIKEKENND
ncbi:MAG: hypothetical protein J1F18_07575 [Lachnospiraceae bacterium]|nr:hypothetical protein [Lachnospiraceae bacterium]